jgi:choline-sulfatase
LRLGHLRRNENWSLRPYWYNSGHWQASDSLHHRWRALYDIAISHLDQELGRFLRRLWRWPGSERSIVIVTADHGEMLGEHRGIVGHMLTLHDNILRVPLVIRHPDYSPGSVVEGVVQTLDLFPTLLEWAGGAPAGVHPAQLKGAPLTQPLAAPASRAGLAFAEEDYSDSYDVTAGLLSVNRRMDPCRYPRQQVAARSAEHKLIWCDDRPAELYNLAADPDESHDLIAAGQADHGALAALEAALARWRAELVILPPQTGPADTPPEDEAVLERLRALGYVA